MPAPAAAVTVGLAWAAAAREAASQNKAIASKSRHHSGEKHTTDECVERQLPASVRQRSPSASRRSPLRSSLRRRSPDKASRPPEVEVESRSVRRRGSPDDVSRPSEMEVPGDYVIKSNTGVCVGLARSSELVDNLHVGTEVKVVEVINCAAENRIRGRIENPYPGYISLRDTGDSFRWAVPRCSLAGVEVLAEDSVCRSSSPRVARGRPQKGAAEWLSRTRDEKVCRAECVPSLALDEPEPQPSWLSDSEAKGFEFKSPLLNSRAEMSLALGNIDLPALQATNLTTETFLAQEHRDLPAIQLNSIYEVSPSPRNSSSSTNRVARVPCQASLSPLTTLSRSPTTIEIGRTPEPPRQTGIRARSPSLPTRTPSISRSRCRSSSLAPASRHRSATELEMGQLMRRWLELGLQLRAMKRHPSSLLLRLSSSISLDVPGLIASDDTEKGDIALALLDEWMMGKRGKSLGLRKDAQASLAALRREVGKIESQALAELRVHGSLR